jgi:hypothetical protein
MDELDRAIFELAEAVKRGANKAKAERLTRPLELAMRKGFRTQGSLFSKKLRTLRAKFSEAAIPFDSDEPWKAWEQALEQPFNEAISQEDWKKIWYEVEQVTAILFSVPTEKAVAKALEIGAVAQITDLALGIKWDLKNPRAKAYLENYGARMVKGINETTRGILQTLVTQATNEGWSYKRTAEAITERFEAFAIGMPQAHIDSRAHLVAVTEVGNAYTEGNLIVAKDLKAGGLEVEKAWSTVGDDKVSEECQANEAASWIEVEEDFPSGHQRPLRFPGCRCDLLTRVKKG